MLTDDNAETALVGVKLNVVEVDAGEFIKLPVPLQERFVPVSVSVNVLFNPPVVSVLIACNNGNVVVGEVVVEELPELPPEQAVSNVNTIDKTEVTILRNRM